MRSRFIRKVRFSFLFASMLLLSACQKTCEEQEKAEAWRREQEILAAERETANRIQAERDMQWRFLEGMLKDQTRRLNPDSVHRMQAQGSRGGSGKQARAAVPMGTIFSLDVDGGISQLASATRLRVRTQATNFAWVTGVASLDNDQLYAAANSTLVGPFSPSLTFVNLTTLQVQQTIPLPATSAPRSMAISPDGKFLYIVGPSQGAVDSVLLVIVDVAARTVSKSIELPGSLTQPEVAVIADGGLAFVMTGRGVAVIDTLTQSLSHTISLPGVAGLHMALDPAGVYLYVAPDTDGGRRGVGTYSIATSQRTNFLPVPDLRSAMAMAISNGGAYLFVEHIVPDAQGRNDFPVMRVLDLGLNQIADTFPWNGPRDIAVTPYQILVIDQP